MAKRRADTELNHDNWDDDTEPVDAGQFQKAEKSTITTRKIITAKSRRSVSQGTSGLFKSFTGFSTYPQSTDMRFNFSPNSGSVGSNSSVIKPLDGCNNSAPFSRNSTEETEYLRQLKTLNLDLLDWIEKHIKDDPLCILSPVFKDYEKHIVDLNIKYPNNSTGNNGDKQPSGVKKASTIPHQAPNGFQTEKDEPSAHSNKQPMMFQSSNHPCPVTSLVTCATTTATRPTFSFGLPSTSSSSSVPPLFKFGHSVPSSSPFASQISSSSLNAVSAPDDDIEVYQPPKPEVKEIKEEGSTYSTRCKLFYKSDTEWRERGVGMLYIKPTTENKFQLLIRADTNLGNILLNVLITKDIPIKLQKNNLTLVCVPSPPLPSLAKSSTTGDDETSRPVPLIVRVKTADAAVELQRQFDRHRGKTQVD